jgi:hypothetical protein
MTVATLALLALGLAFGAEVGADGAALASTRAALARGSDW